MTDRIASPIELGPIPKPAPDLSGLDPLEVRYMRVMGLKDPEKIRGVSTKTLQFLLGIETDDHQARPTITEDDIQGEQ